MSDFLSILLALFLRVSLPVTACVGIAWVARRRQSQALVLEICLFLPAIVAILYSFLPAPDSGAPPSLDRKVLVVLVYLVSALGGVLLMDNLSGEDPPTARDLAVSATTAGALSPFIALFSWGLGCGLGWAECP